MHMYSVCVCPECNSTKVLIDQKTGDEICVDCGSIISDHCVDNSHPTISPEEINNLQMLGRKKIQIPFKLDFALKLEKQLDWTTKSILISSNEIERVSKLMDIPKPAVEYAKAIYKEAKKRGLIVGRSIEGISIASLFYACRFHRIPVNMEDLVNAGEITYDELKKCYKKIITHLKLKVPSLDPTRMVARYATQLGLNEEIQKTTKKFINLYMSMFRSVANTPKGIIAAAIYLASSFHQERISQRSIVKSINVSEVTLRSRLRELQKILMQSQENNQLQNEIIIENF